MKSNRNGMPDIVSNSIAKSSAKKRVGALAALLSAFAWSFISVSSGLSSGLFGVVLTLLLNSLEMVGLDVALTPVKNAVQMDKHRRENFREIMQFIWLSTIVMVYLAEILIVGKGTYNVLLPALQSDPWILWIVTIAITFATAFGTDFALNTFISTFDKEENKANSQIQGSHEFQGS